MEMFKYFGTPLTNQNCTHEEIKSKLNSWLAYHHSAQIILSSRLLSRNVNVKIEKTILLSIVLYGCETLSLALREKHGLRVFEIKVLKRIADHSGRAVQGVGLRSLGCWGRGFKFRSGHGCLSVVFICCVVLYR
jgi:hypothetical protein